MSFKTLALSCLALAPLGAYGGACKPRSTDSTAIISSSMTTVSSEASQSTELSSTISSDLETTISSETTTAFTSETDTTISSEVSQSTEPTSTLTSEIATTISSEAPSTTTSSAPCPSWTAITPYPADKVCAKPVSYDNSGSNPYYLANDRKDNIEQCAKFCGDTQDCVSFYTSDYQPGPGAPIYKLCFLFKGYEEQIGFGEGQDASRAYWEQGCFKCVRDEAEPSAP